MATTLCGFALAAIAAVGVLPPAVWPSAAAVGAVASLALLLLFFHPWLALGFVIDGALLWAVLVVGWTPQATAAP